MKISKETLTEHKKQVLMAAAVIALTSRARRSHKFQGENLTFDVSAWGERIGSMGERVVTIFFDTIDETKKLSGRLAGEVVVSADGKVTEATPDDNSATSDQVVETMRDAVLDDEGWSGQPDENPLQNG